MIGQNAHLLAILIGFLVGARAAEPVVHAQDEHLRFAELAKLSPITHQQLDAFAALVGESKGAVSQRLIADPGMIPLAVEAADARSEHRETGHGRAVLGFGAAGVGAMMIVLGAVAASKYDSSRCAADGEGCDDWSGFAASGLIVFGAIAAVGGSILGTNGIKKMNSETQIETEARKRYQSTDAGHPPIVPPSYSFVRPTASPGTTFRLPVLSLTF